MEKNFFFKIVFDNHQLIQDNLHNWFEEFFKLFEPNKMSGTILTKNKFLKFNYKKLFDGIERELTETDIFSLSIHDDNNFFEVARGDFYGEVTGNLEYDIYEKNKNELLQFIDIFFQIHNGVVAFACSGEDFVWQNVKDINRYKVKNKPTNNLKFQMSPIFEGVEIVDIEHNPGHYHIARDIWFISCWAMWYGREFFNYIPKEVISSFNEGFESNELKDGSIRILLHENIWDYDKPENREIQWAFRRQTGIDEVAHSLSNEPIREENPNPSIHIFQGEFENGGVRVIHYYFNEKGELVTKSKATERRIYEFDQEGKMIWSKIEKL